MIQSLYELIVGNDWAQPSEFWRLRPGEVWWLIAGHIPEKTVTDDDARRRRIALYREAKAKEANGER